MLLAMDVGNTDTVVGVWDGEDLAHHWRVDSHRRRTADEYAVLLSSLLGLGDRKLTDVTDVVIASVVPPLTQNLVSACQQAMGQQPLVVGPGVKTGMPILIDNPKEVGADRIVNALAAWDSFGEAVIVVDFGTATNFDYVSGNGEYMGGIIAPGVRIAGDALFARAAKLPRVEIAKPPSVIGKNTVHAFQSGLYHGYAAMVDGLLGRIAAELGSEPKVVATGGLAPLIASEAKSIQTVDENLTLRGLRLIYDRNK